MTPSFTTASRLALAACLLAPGLGGCDKAASAANPADQPAVVPPIAALPLTPAVATQPMAYAPVASALPQAMRRIRVGLRHDPARYGYIDRANAMSRAFGDTPPDYTVDYQGTRPWIWRSDDGGYRVVEQLPAGQRSYFYARGEDSPFYITDSDGGYAFDNGTLVGIYAIDGSPLDDSYAQQRSGYAGRYYARARAIHQAAQYSRRQGAYANDWQANRDRLALQQQQWTEARARDAAWQSWHDQHRQDEAQSWQDEQNRRTAYSVAIGAGIIGAAMLVSGNHGGDHRNQPAPQDGLRQGQAPAPPIGYRQTVTVQQQPAPVQYHPAARPPLQAMMPAATPRPATPAHRPEPAHQYAPSARTIAPPHAAAEPGYMHRLPPAAHPVARMPVTAPAMVPVPLHARPTPVNPASAQGRNPGPEHHTPPGSTGRHDPAKRSEQPAPGH